MKRFQRRFWGRLRSTQTHKLTLERLEGRDLLATFLVTNVNDSGVGSLRQAILDANADSHPDEIHFDIAPGGHQAIQPLSRLPNIEHPVTIDGTTQPGFSGTPIIELDGTFAVPEDPNDEATASGLRITGSGTTVRGLVINRFAFHAIFVDGRWNPNSGGNIIEGNFLGTDVTGTIDLGNGLDGVKILFSVDNVVGGSTAATRNVISGNDDDGVDLHGFRTHGNLILGNFIGTDLTGTASVGNRSDGVLIKIDANGNFVLNNLLSGNESAGARIRTGAEGNQLAGNLIGTDVSGLLPLPNLGGVVITDGASNNFVGGERVGDGNVISGNAANGVFIGEGSSGNLVQGNLIGTDLTGHTGIGNGRNGVIIHGSGNTVGGTTVATQNVISDNNVGVYIAGDRNDVLGNLVGTDSNGASPLGNSYGILISFC